MMAMRLPVVGWQLRPMPLLLLLLLSTRLPRTAAPLPTPAPKNAMNVLMIAIDDMRPELEPYGQTHMHTPNMQRLADKSTLFTRAYVQVALCMPSRNALLFSRRPDTAYAWEISNAQFPRRCGGPDCAGNQCGARCGIREPGGQLAVTLPGWFLQHGFDPVIGAGKIFHEGPATQNQDAAHSWTASSTNPRTGLFEAPGDPLPTYHNRSGARLSWHAYDAQDGEMSETKLPGGALRRHHTNSRGTAAVRGRCGTLLRGSWVSQAARSLDSPEEVLGVLPKPHHYARAASTQADRRSQHRDAVGAPRQAPLPRMLRILCGPLHSACLRL